MNRKNLLLITLILVLVAIGNWLTEEGVKEVEKRQAKEDQTIQQDYFLSAFTITAMDTDGAPQHRLKATHLKHFSGEGKTELQQPHMVLYKQGQPQWQLTAQQGLLLEQQDEVTLQGDVNVVQLEDEQPLQITTQSLQLQPNSGLAETKEAVTLTQGNNRIEAVGMKIDQNRQRLVLLSQVRGRYETLPR